MLATSERSLPSSTFCRSDVRHSLTQATGSVYTVPDVSVVYRHLLLSHLYAKLSGKAAFAVLSPARASSSPASRAKAPGGILAFLLSASLSLYLSVYGGGRVPPLLAARSLSMRRFKARGAAWLFLSTFLSPLESLDQEPVAIHLCKVCTTPDRICKIFYFRPNLLEYRETKGKKSDESKFDRWICFGKAVQCINTHQAMEPSCCFC